VGLFSFLLTPRFIWHEAGSNPAGVFPLVMGDCTTLSVVVFRCDSTDCIGGHNPRWFSRSCWRCGSGVLANDATTQPMSLRNYLYELVFGADNNDDGPIGGSSAVREAIQEVEDITEGEFTAYLGEPQLIEDGGTHFSRPIIKVPVTDIPYSDDQALFFEVPGGKDTTFLFEELLDVFDLVIDEMESLEGEGVPVSFPDGNVKVNWNDVDGVFGDIAEDVTEASDSDKGAEIIDADEEENGDSDSPINVENEEITGVTESD